MQHEGTILLSVKYGLSFWKGLFQEVFEANKGISISRMRNTGFRDLSRELMAPPNLATPVLLTLSPNILKTLEGGLSPQGLSDVSSSSHTRLMSTNACHGVHAQKPLVGTHIHFL